ncbi:MAG: hypothetical protein ACLFSB_05315 [Chitinispirillaceae bacterium]
MNARVWRRLGKGLRWFLYALLILILLIPPAVYLLGNWWLNTYATETIQFGQMSVQAFDPHLAWNLTVTADSVIYSSPSLTARGGKIVVDPLVAPSLLALKPVVDLNLDSAWIVLPADTADTTEKPDTTEVALPDSIHFPDFAMPVRAAVSAEYIAMYRDTAFVVAAHDLKATTSAKEAALYVDRVDYRMTDSLFPSIDLFINWSDSLIDASLSVARGPDTVRLEAHHSKNNLLHAWDTLHVSAQSSHAYQSFYPQSLPQLSNVDATFTAHTDGRYRFDGDLAVDVGGIGNRYPLRLTDQALSFTFLLDDTTGFWRLKSSGEKEQISLEASMEVRRIDSLPDLANLVDKVGMTLSGHIRGIPVRLADQWVMLGVTIPRMRASSRRIAGEVVTTDGTRLEAVAAKKPKEWGGSFDVDIAPDERLLRVFVDTNMQFDEAYVSGKFSGTELSASSAFFDVAAYGGVADSLYAVHEFDMQTGYTLKPSRLFHDDMVWTLSGNMDVRGDFPSMVWQATNEKHGTIRFSMPTADSMYAEAQSVNVSRVPYALIPELPIEQPVVSAEFAWHMRNQTGHARIEQATARYNGAGIAAEGLMNWTDSILQLQGLRFRVDDSELEAETSVRLNGKDFYELAALGLEDIESVELRADEYNISQTLNVFMEQSPLQSGFVDGRFAYSDTSGFGGLYRFYDIELIEGGNLPELRALRINGNGDTLLVNASTFSQAEPLFNDSLVVAVTGVLSDTQQVRVLVSAASGRLRAVVNGEIQSLQVFDGSFRVMGTAPLPGDIGALRNIITRGEFNIPFTETVEKMRLFTDTLYMTYAIAGMDTQFISAEPQITDGALRVPDLYVRNQKGQELTGNAVYGLIEGGRTRVRLQGEAFAVRWGEADYVTLDDINLRMMADSVSMVVDADIGRADLSYLAPPLNVDGIIQDIDLEYEQMVGRAKEPEASPPELNFEGTLRDMTIAYRLRSIQALQNIFAGNGDRTRKSSSERDAAIQLNVSLQTEGTKNRIDTDVLRMPFTADVTIQGTYPYALANGRFSALDGEIGAAGQSYDIQNLQVKWLNVPVEQGSVSMESAKMLAEDCEPGTTDSCTVYIRLDGELEEMQFTYETDCGGEFGAGANVSAIIFSVRRGCYSPEFAGGGVQEGYGSQALGLLEPTISQSLTRLTERLTGNWIAGTNITGLGALAADSATEAIAIEIVTKQFWGLRLRAKAGYRPDVRESATPWESKLGLEWQPPLDSIITSKKWEDILEDNILIEASISTEPENAESTLEDEISRRLGIIYRYKFWNLW